MPCSVRENLDRQYGRSDPLKVRLETHRLYEERAVDLDVESTALLQLTGRESVLDAGCGPGRFLAHLRSSRHAGRLVGLDQSPGMIAEANVAVDVAGIVGDVTRMPFRHGAFDWAVARHMLYHVADIPRALSELDRVSSKGLLLSTGSARSLPFIDSLLHGVLEAFGLTISPAVMERFSTENAPGILHAAGLHPEQILMHNTLIFTTPEPIVDYVVSCLPSHAGSDDPALILEMSSWLRSRARDGIARAGGTLRDPKSVGMYRVMKK